MNPVIRDRIYAVCVMLVLVLLILVPITPALYVYGQVDTTYTGIVVQQMAENSAFYHLWASASIVVFVVVMVGYYGLHRKTLNGTAGDTIQAVGLGFFGLTNAVNVLEKGMIHVILHTIHFSMDTALNYEQAILFTHHLITVSYSFSEVAAMAGGLGLLCFALGLSGKGLHRFNRPVCLVVAAVSLGMTANSVIGNFSPLALGTLHTAISAVALIPIVWLGFLGFMLWKRSGQPWVSAPPEA